MGVGGLSETTLIVHSVGIFTGRFRPVFPGVSPAEESRLPTIIEWHKVTSFTSKIALKNHTIFQDFPRKIKGENT